MLKAKIKEYIQSEKGSKIVVCSSSPKNNPNPKGPEGDGGEVIIDKGGNNGGSKGGSNGGDTGGETGEPVEPTQKLGATTITCNLENNVNVIRFGNSAEGVTYDYKITCESGCNEYDYSKSGSTSQTELYLDLHSEYEGIKLRTFRIEVTARLGSQTKTSILTGVKLKCKK
jgi:hypothetical protein